jgi:hypothetical protein
VCFVLIGVVWLVLCGVILCVVFVFVLGVLMFFVGCVLVGRVWLGFVVVVWGCEFGGVGVGFVALWVVCVLVMVCCGFGVGYWVVLGN